jgi:hypothetical protein
MFFFGARAMNASAYILIASKCQKKKNNQKDIRNIVMQYKETLL